MANHNSTQVDCAPNQFTGLPMDMLIALIDAQAKETMETLRRIECVARGGAAHANSLDSDGDPIDSVSGGIFSTIINATSDVSALHDLRKALSELHQIAARPIASA